MKAHWIEKDGTLIDLPNLSAVIDPDGKWFVATCPELGIASQGSTRKEAQAMLGEAVSLWLECASAQEIKRHLKRGARVTALHLA
ncbi:MAG: type II toxin-antitoxin system HicB family antitoxin [Prosthecobacter sp.]|nr:type II toxin-antitoxin system HicB family antitoxin [Prosthecobacter sp.]